MKNSDKKLSSSLNSIDINIKNYYFTNDTSDMKGSNDIKFIGNKRLKKAETIKNENENLFLEIKKLYNKYIGKDSYYKLYEQESGVFDKNITLVEEGIPVCVIYLYRNIITKIYLITEQIFVEDKNETSDVLKNIKNTMQNYQKMNPSKFIYF